MASNCQITGCKETTKTKNEVTEVNNTDLPNNNNNNVTKNKNGSNNNTKNTNSNNNSSKNNSNEKFKNDSSAVRNKSPKKNAKQSNFNNKPRINESNTVISSSKVETSSSVTTTTTSAASTVPADSECTENYILTYGPVSSITNGDVYNVISNDLTDVAYQSYTYETVDQSVTSGPSQTYYCYEDVSSIGTDTSAADTLYSNTINPSETLYSNEINPSNNLYSSAVVNNPENLYSTTVDPSQTLYSTTVNPSISIHSVNVQPSETLYSTTLSSSGTTVYATEISPSITLHDTNGNTPEALYSTVSPSGTTVYSADMNPTIALHTIDVGPSEALYGTTGTTVYATEMSPSVTLHESNGNPSETLYTTTISPSGTTVYATEICPSITLHESNVSSPEALYSSTVDASGNTVYTTDISPSITLHNSNISPPETLYTATLSPSETTVYTANHHETLYANAINPQETLYSNNINSSEQLYSNNVDSSDDLYSNDVNSSENLYNNDNTVFYKNTSKESEVFNKAKSSNFAETQQRHAYLNYEQVCRLNDVMNEVVCIHGRGNFPTLEVKLRDLVTVVRDKLRTEIKSGGEGMKVHDIRLNGGAASHVLATESQPYNDLDLIFGVELSNGRNYDKVKAAVLGSLFDLLPEGVSRKRITTCSLKEAYVSKMVKVSNDGDRWSLISLGNSRGHRNVELKFVDTMRRQFEFSVDSFQIVLDSLLMFYERSKVQMNESFYPTIIGESVYGDFQEAIYHLQKKLISTRHPEEIRGGGLLKYCNLLVKNYKPAQPNYIKTLERYMCSRFFIDFPDITQQRAKLENYLWNHFVGVDEEALKYQYLMLLHSVVEESTVCLMGHERRQTLALIENLAYQVFCQEQQKRLTNHQPPPGPPTYVYANGYYYTPVIPACYACSCNTTWMACSS